MAAKTMVRNIRPTDRKYQPNLLLERLGHNHRGIQRLHTHPRVQLNHPSLASSQFLASQAAVKSGREARRPGRLVPPSVQWLGPGAVAAITTLV